MRGVPVLGAFDDLENVVAMLRQRKTPVTRLVLTPSAFDSGSGVESLLMQGRRLGLAINRLPSLDETGIRLRTGEPFSLRWALVDMIAEYARHNGHADLLRERIDGATGY